MHNEICAMTYKCICEIYFFRNKFFVCSYLKYSRRFFYVNSWLFFLSSSLWSYSPYRYSRGFVNFTSFFLFLYQRVTCLGWLWKLLLLLSKGVSSRNIFSERGSLKIIWTVEIKGSEKCSFSPCLLIRDISKKNKKKQTKQTNQKQYNHRRLIGDTSN